MTERELKNVNDEMASVQRHVSDVDVATIRDVQDKVAVRRVVAKSMCAIVGVDPVANTASRELGSLATSAAAASQAAAIVGDASRRLTELVERLRAAVDTKSSLLDVDERLLHIGLTPSMPPTPLRSSRGEGRFTPDRRRFRDDAGGYEDV